MNREMNMSKNRNMSFKICGEIKGKTNYKYFSFIISLAMIFSFGSRAIAYIPSSRMILDKVVEGALKTPIYVEQEVRLVSSQSMAYLKEQWLFENENSAKVIVRGEKDLQDQLAFQIQAADRSQIMDQAKLGDHQKRKQPLMERVFFIKGTEGLMRFLVQSEIVGEEIFNSQAFKKIPGNNGFQYQPEIFLRLGRVGGKVAYVLGPSPKDENSTPGFWVEQDLFHIFKLRNSKGEEIRFEKMTNFSKGIRWPKEMQMSWGSLGSGLSMMAQVQTNIVKVPDASLKQLFQKKIDRKTLEFEKHPAKNMIEEFYQRFR